ncbi:MAG: GNAT superfamily N-acetyltransferase [Bradymonadia bacterium]|jgi:GNAT superfamily N-acetyltransferase
MRPDLDALARLRHQRLARHPQYRNDHKALGSIRTALARVYDRAHRQGQAWVLDSRACVLVVDEPVAWHGAAAREIWVDHADDPAAEAWVCARLSALGRTPTAECLLDVAYDGVRRHLLRTGWGIDSISMVASTADALRGLMASRPPELTHPAVEIRTLTPADVDAVVNLSRRVFTRAPEFCWFGADVAFLQERQAALQAPTQGPREVLVQHGEIVGYWAADFDPSPIWGRAAGLDFVLLPPVQGIGLGRVGYRRLLEALIARDIGTFKGGTNQPPVLHLARRMGRTPWRTWMRASAPFAPDHFAALLPQLALSARR